jgi:hypothetical protein
MFFQWKTRDIWAATSLLLWSNNKNTSSGVATMELCLTCEIPKWGLNIIQ